MFIPQGTERVIPSWFSRALADIDPNLICYFNPLRQRWIIDRCTRDGELRTNVHTHTPECPRTNVLVVQGERKEYMPLCEEVLNTLRARDSWSQFGNAENYLRNSQHIGDDLAAKQAQDVKNLYAEASVDNRRQLNEAYTIQQTHNLE